MIRSSLGSCAPPPPPGRIHTDATQAIRSQSNQSMPSLLSRCTAALFTSWRGQHTQAGIYVIFHLMANVST